MNIPKILTPIFLSAMLALSYANDLHQYDNPERLAKAKECIINNMEGDECKNIPFRERDFIDLHYKTGDMRIIDYLTQNCEKAQNIGWQTHCCVTLGRIFLKGRGVFGKGKGVEQNYAQALKYMKKSCDLGYGVGCVFLGDMYLYGYGTRTNPQLARELYGKACDLGNQEGCDKYN